MVTGWHDVFPMAIDQTVYPDERQPPCELATLAAQADYVQRICAAFDFGIVPERADWKRFREWTAIFIAFPLPHSPAYHTFRAWYGWEPVPRGRCGLVPPWRVQDMCEGRTDPCEDRV